jgi:hypothetical protein
MPSGPPALHEKFCALDPEGCGDRAAIAFLEACGYRLRRDWFWDAPKHGLPETPAESEAINYLCWEWDFGGVKP